MSRIVTFYSYKGGTGRSMALANVAWILASAGNRVLTIDWDLEAPGLHRYFQPFLTDKELTGQESQGLMDMVIDFAVQAATPENDKELVHQRRLEAADFSKWRQKLRWPSGEAIRLGEKGSGEIDFVPAGRQSADYANRVNNFDWHSFYEKLSGGEFFDAAKSRMMVYDYVLIDSRTGVSDTSGICTVQMPDTLVVCFTLNYQSIKGALAVASSVKQQRPDIKILPLATRIDGSETNSLNRMKGYAAKAFGPLLDKSVDTTDYWYKMEVPYFPRYAYAERLALFEEQRSISTSTLPAMERLTDLITSGRVRTAGTLPTEERLAALAEFDGLDVSDITHPAEITEKLSPIRIFIAHAKDDHAIALEIQLCLQRLAGDSLEVLQDQSAYASDLRRSIETALEDSDVLIALNSEALSARSSWVGFEVGFFSARMEEEKRNGNRRPRHLFRFDFDESPRSIITISAEELLRGPEHHLENRSDLKQDQLDRFFFEILSIVKRAQPRLEIDASQIADTLIPLREALFENLRLRISSETILNGILEVDFVDRLLDEATIPANSRVSLNGKASTLLGLSELAKPVSWHEFKQLLRDDPFPLTVVEQVVLGVLAGKSMLGADPAISLRNGSVLRMIPIRFTRYYGGRVTVRLQLVLTSRKDFHVSRDAEVSMHCLSTAIKFKSIFGRGSEVSSQTFRFAQNFDRLKQLSQRLMELLIALETETNAAGLQDETLSVLFDDSSAADTTEFLRSVELWPPARAKLGKIASNIIGASNSTDDFEASRDRMVEAIEEFKAVEERSSSMVTKNAMRILSKMLSRDEPILSSSFGRL